MINVMLYVSLLLTKGMYFHIPACYLPEALFVNETLRIQSDLI